jgi:Transmembrane secretion effector
VSSTDLSPAVAPRSPLRGPPRLRRNPLRSSPGGPLRGPLGSSNFRRLVTCNVISIAGSAVSFVALPFAVLRIGGSASDIGYVATAGLIPLLAFLLLGGVIADRLPRHQVIVAANALQACAQGTAAALVITGQARIWLGPRHRRGELCRGRPPTSRHELPYPAPRAHPGRFHPERASPHPERAA